MVWAIKYQYTKVIFQEIPDEITLCIAISGCKIHCKDCNQKNLWKDEGKDLNIQELDSLINANKGYVALWFRNLTLEQKEGFKA